MFRYLETVFVWDQLKNKLTKADIEWLAQHRTVWKDYVPKNKIEWARNNAGSVRELAMRIMNILDAKKDRQELPETNVLLPKSYLLELAKMFDVSQVYANEKTPNWRIENAIIDSLVRQTGFKPF